MATVKKKSTKKVAEATIEKNPRPFILFPVCDSDYMPLGRGVPTQDAKSREYNSANADMFRLSSDWRRLVDEIPWSGE